MSRIHPGPAPEIRNIAFQFDAAVEMAARHAFVREQGFEAEYRHRARVHHGHGEYAGARAVIRRRIPLRRIGEANLETRLGQPAKQARQLRHDARVYAAKRRIAGNTASASSLR